MRFSLKTLLLLLTLAGPYVCWIRLSCHWLGASFVAWVWGTACFALALVTVPMLVLMAHDAYDVFWLRNHRSERPIQWIDNHRWRLP